MRKRPTVCCAGFNVRDRSRSQLGGVLLRRVGFACWNRSQSRVIGYALAVALVYGSATAARALPRTLTCIYTEPFITTTYVARTRTLIIERAPGQSRTVIRRVAADTARPATLRFRTSRRVVQTVNLSQRGSDGMSDKVFPYTGHLVSGNLTGGCE